MRFPLPGCHSLGSLKPPLSLQEGSGRPSDPVHARRVVNATGVTAAHLGCISINPDTEQHNGCQMLRCGNESGRLIDEVSVSAHVGSLFIVKSN